MSEITPETMNSELLEKLAVLTPPSANRTLSDADIDNRFGFHKATTEGENATLPVHTELRLIFKALAGKLDDILPPGRAKAVMFTELETVSMWAHKANAELSPLVEE